MIGRATRLGQTGLALAAWFALGAAAAPAPAWRLTPNGLGPVRIGMTRAQVTRLVGARLEGETLTPGCVETQAVRGWTGIGFMFEAGRLTRISVGDGARVVTPRGIGVGGGEDAVRRAYGSTLAVEPHKYDDAPARYLTYWTVPRRRGVRFETDAHRRVVTIHAGGPSIEYVEGCL